METALEGVRILDFSRFLAGPFATMILADLGAEVTKIESSKGREEIPPSYFYKGQDAYFLSTNRNKKSITLDIKKPKGKEIFYELVKFSDVVLDNFRTGAVEGLGIDYATLSRINPRIICCSITAFGPTGPYRDRPGFDLTAQALGGMMSLTGEPGRPPVRAGLPIADLAAGMFAAHGILAALYAREHTGKGQKVDTSLLEAQVALTSYEASGYFVTGEVPTPIGSGHRMMHPYRAYKTKDDYVVVAAMYAFDKLCRALGREDLARDPRFNSLSNRFEHSKEQDSLLEQIFSTKTTQEWLKILSEGDVPCAPVNTLDKVFSHPQVLDRDMLVTIEHVLGGEIKVVGNPIKMSATPPAARKRFDSPPILGQHTQEILTNLLGYSEEKVEELRREGII